MSTSPAISVSPSSPSAISVNRTHSGFPNTAVATALHISTKKPDHTPSSSRIDNPTLSGCTPHRMRPRSKTVDKRSDLVIASSSAASARLLFACAVAYVLAAGVNASRAAIAVDTAWDIDCRFACPSSVCAAHEISDATVSAVRAIHATAKVVNTNGCRCCIGVYAKTGREALLATRPVVSDG